MSASKGSEKKKSVVVAAPSTGVVHSVVVHPLVLLAVTDHYTRVAEGTQRRVVGVLLGSSANGVTDVTNCYALPFEEDSRNPKIWFVDHNFHEKMFAMFRKVNASERVVGWYSSGPRIRPNDIDVNELFRRYCRDPVLVVIETKPSSDVGLPTKAYVSVEKISPEDGTSSMQFEHIESSIGAVEAEEVGVEHLLRDVHDSSVSSLTAEVRNKVASLKSLAAKLNEMEQYLDMVVKGEMPANKALLDQLQDVFNLLPNLASSEMVEAFAVKSNDSMLALYLASLIRSVVSLHELINNRLDNREFERKTFGFAEGEAPKEKEKVLTTSEKKEKK